MPEYEVTGIWWGNRPPTPFSIRVVDELVPGATFESNVVDGHGSPVVWLTFCIEDNHAWCVPWRLGTPVQPVVATTIQEPCT